MAVKVSIKIKSDFKGPYSDNKYNILEKIIKNKT